MRFGRTAAVYFVSQVVLSLAGFLATFFIARLLGASALGTYMVAVALLFWLKVPANGVRAAIEKRVSEGRERGEYLSAGFVAAATIAGVATALVLGFSDAVNAYVGASVSGILVLLVWSNVFFDSIAAGLTGQKKVAHEGVVRVLERVGRLGGQVGLILLGYGVSGLIVGHTLSLFVAGLVGLAVFDVRPKLPSREHLRSLADYGRYSWLGSLQSQMFGWMDTTVLAFFVASSLIGVYEVAWTLASTLALISVAVQQTLFPELSDLGVDERYDRIHHYLNEGFVFVGIFAIPGLFGAAVLGPDILRIYSPEFTRGATVLLVLIVARTIAAFGSQLLSAINAIDRPDVAFRINGAFVATNLLLNVVLISRYGWYGAAVATALSAALSLILGYYSLSTLIGRPRIPVAEIAREVAASLVMTVVLLGLVGQVPRNHVVTVLLVAVGAGVYTVVLVAISTRIRQKALSLLPARIVARV